MKPSDTQLKEFDNKLNKLNKNILFDYIIEKLESYRNMTFGTNIKSFTVLYDYLEIIICN